ncbi:MAG: hypothetical protein SFZ03_05000 [Candidatus Melainabacteria bacterium]|nr:hypothetical protein [Candidatus Melainabacteria bacterium]
MTIDRMRSGLARQEQWLSEGRTLRALQQNFDTIDQDGDGFINHMELGTAGQFLNNTQQRGLGSVQNHFNQLMFGNIDDGDASWYGLSQADINATLARNGGMNIARTASIFERQTREDRNINGLFDNYVESQQQLRPEAYPQRSELNSVSLDSYRNDPGLQESLDSGYYDVRPAQDLIRRGWDPDLFQDREQPYFIVGGDNRSFHNGDLMEGCFDASQPTQNSTFFQTPNENGWVAIDSSYQGQRGNRENPYEQSRVTTRFYDQNESQFLSYSGNNNGVDQVFVDLDGDGLRDSTVDTAGLNQRLNGLGLNLTDLEQVNQAIQRYDQL